MKQDLATAALLAQNSSTGFQLTKSKMNACRLIMLTSLLWVLIDAFIILFYVNDSGNSLMSLPDCARCELKLERLERELSDQRKAYAKLVQTSPMRLHVDKAERIEKLKRFEYQSPESSLKKDELPEIFRKDESEAAKVKEIKEWFKEDYSDEKVNPTNWPGENGRGVVIPSSLKKESEKRFTENQFNVVASELIALNRNVPDQRSQACQKREYPVDLPTTSIIIVHHNEANSTLLRTLISIVRKTPKRYLKEIILVDDKSEDREYLNKPLDDFVKTLPCNVVVLRNEERMGLMRSRLRGAAIAKGDTMTFLDAHVEVTNGWLPPLLFEIKKNRRTVACPIIDVINEDTFAYVPGIETTFGGFNYRLSFKWLPLSKAENERRGGDLSLPMRTPTMAGGLFTIDRQYFYDIGSYDEGMEIWGAENIEMSFRVWMCGGTLLILPCSHVGHVFRKHTPYKFPGGTEKVIYKNNRRMIDVWTDEYVGYFHKIIPDLETVEVGDLSQRFELRKKLQCKSFRWYLENIYPDAPLPVNFLHLGAIKNPTSGNCLDSMGRKTGEDVGASLCHSQGGNQLFEYSKSNQLKHSGNCLDTRGKPGSVRMETCDPESNNQMWDYDVQNEFFRNRASQTCLAVYGTGHKVIITVNCEPDNQYLVWTFTDPMIIEKTDDNN